MQGEHLDLLGRVFVCVVPIGSEGAGAWTDPSAYHVTVYLWGISVTGPTGIHSLQKSSSAGGLKGGLGVGSLPTSHASVMP